LLENLRGNEITIVGMSGRFPGASDICLGVEKISVHDNFFDLGGDSLMAIHLLAQLHTAFSTELHLPELLERPTVAGMAEVIEERQASLALK